MPESNKIRCLVIDDELPSREILKKHINGVEALELCGTCSNAVEAIAFLKDHRVDLLFLDIQMPHLLGTNFIRTLKSSPKVIFTTAYRKYAVEGFELDAVDFLLKPINFERFLKAVNKVLQINLQANNDVTATSENHTESVPPFLYFRANRKMVKVLFNDICVIFHLSLSRTNVEIVFIIPRNIVPASVACQLIHNTAHCSCRIYAWTEKKNYSRK